MNHSNKSILVTGGARIIGADACKATAAAGYKPTAWQWQQKVSNTAG
jgi:NAD(P)-dependent dehydrogenase (short-subunit alcohol dehydrogenase family)